MRERAISCTDGKLKQYCPILVGKKLIFQKKRKFGLSHKNKDNRTNTMCYQKVEMF